MMIIVEYICYCLIPSAVLCLWIVGIVTLIRSLVKKKDHPYSKEEKQRCALDILFLIASGWCATRYLVYGFMGQPEGWRNILLNVTSPIANLIAPLSIWSIAMSINKRKDGISGKYLLAEILCILVHVCCLTAFYLIYGSV